MKITCQACAAKYTIADEKVVGKTVKIRCKKCGANIVVNAGEVVTAAGPATADAPPPLPALGSPQVPGEAPWTVNVADGDQRTMSVTEIVSEFQRGVITEETYCWRDGMADWLPLRDVHELSSACGAGAQPAPPGGQEDEDAATRIHEAPAPRPAGPAVGNGSGLAAAPAARRSPARAPSADLFGNVAQAGGEEDVLTSAPAGTPEHHEDAKPIGARNENSVLFSLGALTAPSAGGDKAESKAPATNEASGLIDIRALSAQLNATDDKKKQSRVDDIMNLGGGGAFMPALSAPALTAPPLEEFTSSPAQGGGAAPGKSKGIIYVAAGGGVVLIAAAIGAAVMMTHPKADDKAATAATPSASAAEVQPSASAASPAPSPAPSVAAPSAPASAAAPAASPAPSPTEAAQSAPKPAPTAAAAPAETHVAVATPPPAQEKPAAEPAAAQFDMGEAKARLSAIAGAVQSCKRGDASGTGRVVVTFATNGAAQSATVSGAPFEGTPTGACVASKFRGARVPPFAGQPFTVSKSFTIN